MPRDGYITDAEDMLTLDPDVGRDTNGRITDYKRDSIVRFVELHGFSKKWTAEQLSVTLAEIEETLAWNAAEVAASSSRQSSS